MNNLKSKRISFILALIMIISSIISLSNISNVFAENSENLNSENCKKVEWGPKNLEEDEIFTIDFGYEVDINNIVRPEGIDVSYKNGTYTFTALKKLEDVKVHIYYCEKSGESQTEQENGGAGVGNEAGEGEGGLISWGDFDMGKHAWRKDNNRVQYAIRIDLSLYKGVDYIILVDNPSTNLKRDQSVNLTVSKLSPNEQGVVENTGEVEYDVLEHKQDGGEGFTIKIPIVEDALAYDVGYYMIHDGEDYTNNYTIYTVEEYTTVVGGGGVTGDIGQEPNEPVKPDEPNEPVKPDEPNEPVKPDEPNEPNKPNKPEDRPYEKPGNPTKPKEETKPNKPNKNEPIKPEEPKEVEVEEIEEVEEPRESNIDSNKVESNKKEKEEEIKIVTEKPKENINVFDENKAPQTGDEFNLVLNILVLMASILGLYALSKKRK